MFRKSSADCHEAGFTLIEILVAIAIFSIAITALINGMLMNTRINTTVQQKLEAARIIEAQFEGYRQTNDYNSLQSGSRQRVVESILRRNGINYTVVATFCPEDLPAGTITAMPCSLSAVYIRLEVKNGSKNLQKAETYYTKFGKVTE